MIFRIKEKNANLVLDLTLFLVLTMLVFVFQRYVIYYHSQLPVFLYSRYYFDELMSYPGGMSEYLASFFRQFFVIHWLGALVSTLLIFSVSKLTINFFSLVYGFKKLRAWYLIPLLIFAFLHGCYRYDISFTVALLLVLIAVNICIYFRNIKPFVRLIICIFIGSIIFKFTGGMFLYFILLIVLFEVSLIKTKRSNVYFPLMLLFFGISYPYIAYKYLYNVELRSAYFQLLPDGTDFFILIAAAAYLFFVVLVSVILSFSNIVHKKPSGNNYTGNKTLFFRIAYYLLFLVLFVVYNMYFKNKTDSTRLKIQYLADNRMWNEVLETVNKESVIDRLSSFHVNRALYYTGKMGDEMFHYPQNYGVDGLFIDRYNDNKMLEGSSDIYFDLGFVNESKHWAWEAFVYFGNRPRLLKRLALIYLINGNEKASIEFLNTLSKTLFYKKWAKKYLKIIDNKDGIGQDSLIAEKRKFIPRFDFFSDRQNPDLIMKFMLKANKNNKMAFEYLISYYLVSNKFITFHNNLAHYGVFNYFDKMPIHYQQALLVYENIIGKSILEMNDFKVDNDVIMDFKGYGKIIDDYRGNLVAARRSLKVYYENTYWYYLNFVSPVTNKIMIEEEKKNRKNYR